MALSWFLTEAVVECCIIEETKTNHIIVRMERGRTKTMNSAEDLSISVVTFQRSLASKVAEGSRPMLLHSAVTVAMEFPRLIRRTAVLLSLNGPDHT